MKQIAALVIVGLSLLLGAFAPTVVHDHTTRWTGSAPEFLKLGDRSTVRYAQSDEGPPLMTLHTIRTPLDYFEKFVPELNRHNWVYVLDFAGHGHSSLRPGGYTELLLRQAGAEFISRFDLRDVTLVAESIVGVPPLTVFADQSERVTKVASLPRPSFSPSSRPDTSSRSKDSPRWLRAC
ncbi:pimeloyl-ACP methyl ester carboxylesterase [Hydrogenophaga palleronii]|uniref:Pimeloyl-ACP methyl ester carboxylesterase n=1 Tax=Hydrogenophaga palleronii TaxID=65655 RepID=A0ABU1WS57_9BURK|nr:hypothetical protein [Hydrogenophaga palleronii]MDR7151899.1 pimeloyl-ACP methyl ester carboxylesterase [Hydrogenophaga palleronii]